jgi:hypothetical protein
MRRWQASTNLSSLPIVVDVLNGGDDDIMLQQQRRRTTIRFNDGTLRRHFDAAVINKDMTVDFCGYCIMFPPL